MKYSNYYHEMCPDCSNEEISVSDVYCKICREELKNKCSDIINCGVTLDNNARYCTKCGEKSTFFEKNFFNDWTVEKREHEESHTINPNDVLDDEDLPF